MKASLMEIKALDSMAIIAGVFNKKDQTYYLDFPFKEYKLTKEKYRLLYSKLNSIYSKEEIINCEIAPKIFNPLIENVSRIIEDRIERNLGNYLAKP